MKIGIAIPTYNRENDLLRSFERVYQDGRVECVTISDDGSHMDVVGRLRDKLRPLSKVRFFDHPNNVGCYKNKARALDRVDAAVPWNLLLDSDNTITREGLNAIQQAGPWDRETLYLPSFAMPIHDYRAYEGRSYTRKTIGPVTDAPRFLTALNTGNFFVHREAFREVFDVEADPMAADSLFFVYCWLNAGRTIRFVPGFYYFHQVSSQDSNYDRYALPSRPIFNGIANELRLMR